MKRLWNIESVNSVKSYVAGNELNSFNIKNPSIEKDFLYVAAKIIQAYLTNVALTVVEVIQTVLDNLHE